LRRRSNASSANKVYPHGVRADAHAIIVAVRIRPYSLAGRHDSDQVSSTSDVRL